jgi:hypothetical protein
MKRRRKMNLAEVKKRAKVLGVNVSRMGKLELIREVQKKEGNFPCFGTATGYWTALIAASGRIVSGRTIEIRPCRIKTADPQAWNLR